jgi:glutaredoxin 3
MAEIVIYTTQICPYCVRAKDLFRKKGVQYNEVDVTNHEARAEMMEKTGGKRSVPQIFIGERHIGGCDDLYALETEGKLDALIK